MGFTATVLKSPGAHNGDAVNGAWARFDPGDEVWVLFGPGGRAVACLGLVTKHHAQTVYLSAVLMMELEMIYLL